MTKKEAIYLLNNLRAFAEEDDDPAIDMAIEALKYDAKEEILRAVEILVDMINSVDRVGASIYLFGDGNATISIFPTDEESEE